MVDSAGWRSDSTNRSRARSSAVSEWTVSSLMPGDTPHGGEHGLILFKTFDAAPDALDVVFASVAAAAVRLRERPVPDAFFVRFYRLAGMLKSGGCLH